MALVIRPRTESDDVLHLDEGNPLGALTAMYLDMAEAEDMECQWYAAELDGLAVGHGAVFPMPVAAGGFGQGVVNVRPEARRRGVATALRAALEEAARGKVAGVLYNIQDGSPEAVAALDAWGLGISETHHEAVLDLAALDRAAYTARAAVEGVRIEPLPPYDEMTEADWTSVHAFAQDRFREAPDAADGGGLLPYETFRGIVEEPWMLVTAREEATGELLGLTFVIRRGEDMNTFFTGVSAAARGRGVAVALKVTQALGMAERGIGRLFTQNMVGNEPILAANRTMGFVHASSYCDVPVSLA